MYFENNPNSPQNPSGNPDSTTQNLSHSVKIKKGAVWPYCVVMRELHNISPSLPLVSSKTADKVRPLIYRGETDAGPE
jgi:hypothetical protein